MKHCLELLKGVVPLAGDLTKHTTLGLLTNATSLIKVLRDSEHVQKTTKEQLVREQQYLRWQLDQMTNGRGQYRGLAGQYRVRPSLSESSSGSNESSSSTSSELDDVDVTGSGLSDVDDRSSDASTDICGIASERLIIGSL